MLFCIPLETFQETLNAGFVFIWCFKIVLISFPREQFHGALCAVLTEEGPILFIFVSLAPAQILAHTASYNVD